MSTSCRTFFSSGRCSAAAVQASGDSGTVIRVADGDTVTLRFANRVERRVRLIGVDAPEMDDPREDVAYRAFLSKRSAFHHLYGRKVGLTYDFPAQDEHGRVLAYLWSRDNKLINDEVLRNGYAVLFTLPPNVKHIDRLRAAQVIARENKRGIWGRDGLKQLPSEYRKEHPRADR